MKRCLVTSLSLFIMLLSLGIRGAASGSVVVDRVVAVVNDEIITMSDLQREEAKKTGLTDKRLILEDMIDRKLQIAAAKRTGMDMTDKELNDTVADIMKRNSMDGRQFEAALAKEGLTLEQYKAELREQLTLSRVFNKYVRSGTAVDEAEMRAYYERNVKSFSLPEEIRVRHIFLKLQDKAAPARQKTVRDKAQSVYDLAKRGKASPASSRSTRKPRPRHRTATWGSSSGATPSPRSKRPPDPSSPERSPVRSNAAAVSTSSAWKTCGRPSSPMIK